MAKRQNFIVGSTNAVTENLTSAQLDAAFDRYEILTADKLDGVFNAVSDYSNDSSNEIANAIQSITGSQPTGATQDELASALQQMRSEIETTSLTFKGYVSSTEPSASDYDFKVGDIWIQSATMPTVFPVAIAGIWDGTQWATTTDTYTQKDFDFFRDINNGEGYYWFGGEWTIMSTDMDTTYFELNPSGKWAIKTDVNLPGWPTTTTPDSADKSTKIATTEYIHNFGERYVTNCITEIPQDIKLELNNGTLTLKAGSKVYVPNGSSPSSDINNFVPAGLNANLGSHTWRALAYDGTKFIALGSSGYISTSTDGTNWTVATQNSNLGSHEWRTLAYNGTKFVALGYYSGYISTSTDGTNWTVATQNSNLGNFSWIALAYDGTKFVALGDNGWVSTSTDGTNWTVATQNSNLGSHYWRGLAYGGTKFVALGQDGYISVTIAGLTFDEVVIASDLTSSYTDARNIKVLMFYDYESQANFRIRLVDECFSGSTAPTSELNMVWHDTVNNIIKFSNDYGTTWIRQYSLPVCIATVTATGFTSIDQVFNGFGYIGSTVFALPGVKGLIPDGRNADGTLKNIEKTVESVLTNIISAPNIPVQMLLRITGGVLELKSTAAQTIYYDNKNNYIVRNGTITTEIMCGLVLLDSNSKIVSNNLKTAFHAVDYSDTECMTKGALSNIVNGADTKVGDVYYTPATGNTSVYAPSGGKWLVLYVAEVYISTAVLYLYSNDLYHKVGEVVSGGTQITQARSGYGAYVSLLKIA